MARAAVFFHYFERDEIYKENLVFFLSVAYRRDLEFFIIISGPCSVSLPDIENVKYLQVENINNDFGGYISALEKLRGRIGDFEFFIFVNSSARGPFFSRLFDGRWVDLFCDKLASDTHLVGSSINIIHDTFPHSVRFKAYYGYRQPYSHVQTTAYALTFPAMRHLLGIGFYDVHERLSKADVICRYEIRLSQEIKRAGWNIKACLSRYNTIDYRLEHTDINFTSDNGDPLYRGAYFGSTARPRELVFVKTNRNLISAPMLYWHTLTSLLFVDEEEIRGWSEYKALRRIAIAKLYWSSRSALKKYIMRLLR